MAFPTNGLRLLYDFNEASGPALDRSGHAYSGTVYGSGVQGGASSFGTGYRFDAFDESVNVPRLPVPATGSLAVWLLPRVAIGDGNTWCVFSQHNSANAANGRIELGIYRGGSDYFMYARSGATGAQLAFTTILTADVLTLLGWAWDTAGNVTCYRNGVQAGSTITGFALGSDTNGYSQFNGLNNGAVGTTSLPGDWTFDAAALWNRNLTAGEWTDAQAYAGESLPYNGGPGWFGKIGLKIGLGY